MLWFRQDSLIPNLQSFVYYIIYPGLVTAEVVGFGLASCCRRIFSADLPKQKRCWNKNCWKAGNFVRNSSHFKQLPIHVFKDSFCFRLQQHNTEIKANETHHWVFQTYHEVDALEVTPAPWMTASTPGISTRMVSANHKSSNYERNMTHRWVSASLFSTYSIGIYWVLIW